MKWFLIVQFVVFSMFSIAEIDQKNTSTNNIYLDRIEVITPIVDNNSIKPIQDITYKYIVISTSLNLLENQEIKLEYKYKKLFKSHLIDSQLARSPPFPLS